MQHRSHVPELPEIEREYLRELCERRRDELIHELHHAVRHAYRLGLKEELEMAERLAEKFGVLVPA